MNRNNAPRLDDFGPNLYMAAWQAVSESVMVFLEPFSNGDVQLELVKPVYMVLLPKMLGETVVTAFRPIYLQNGCVKNLGHYKHILKT